MIESKISRGTKISEDNQFQWNFEDFLLTRGGSRYLSYQSVPFTILFYRPFIDRWRHGQVSALLKLVI